MDRGVRRRDDSRLEARVCFRALGVEAATARLSLPCRAAGTTEDSHEEPAPDHVIAPESVCQQRSEGADVRNV